jgi:hypothetical protein
VEDEVIVGSTYRRDENACKILVRKSEKKKEIT